MDKKTKGAWVIHHGRKVATDVHGAAEFSAIDLAAKAAGLLARLAESRQAVLTAAEVTAAARVGGLNPKTEMEACLAQLERRRLIDRGAQGLSVLGINSETALMHAADLLEDNEPQPNERAAIELAELASEAPTPVGRVSEFIGDTYHFTKADTSDFLSQSHEIVSISAEN